MDRDQRSFALSAARSALFNSVLSQRVADATWNRLLPGEVVNLDGTGSVFVAALPDPVLDERCARLDIHPTGPLCGVGESRVTADALQVEQSSLAPWARWQEGLQRLNVEQQRRALRVAVSDLSWEYARPVLTLRFRLARGSFATAVLREIVTTTIDAGDFDE
jgi:tRNA pseudouridine13 synthase